jgi:transglutaminase-like putative cysteine protease
VKLPLGEGFDGPDDAMGTSAFDTSVVDWSRVRRSAYIISQNITYQYEGPVRRLRQRLVVQPREQHGDQRRVSRRVEVIDATPRRVRAAPDGFGNHVVDIEVPYVAEQVTFLSTSVVERRADEQHLASGALLHDRRLLDTTPLTAPDGDVDALVRDLADTRLQGGELALAACQRVYELMQYAHGVTTVRTTAAEAFAKRTGVCQDFAHVLLAITRGLGLPSRYVSGQLLGSGGSHAWVEVLVPDGAGHARVMALDPTHGCSVGLTYLTVAVGRDYNDVAPVSGTYVASHAGTLTMSKRVSLVRIDDGEGVPARSPMGHRFVPPSRSA